ncbi:MAG: HAD hydrolase-like protein [Candidatus Cloacimonadota bacterium]|nr:HAD hydrolase-like protein [Candidatus Cloacimonadota bacterium]
MRYSCLIIDHDDTTVNSTATIHYPAYCEIMNKLRSHQPKLKQDLKGWFLKNFDPGVSNYYKKELKFNKKEQKIEYAVWRSYTENKELVPEFYDGILEILVKFQKKGGKVVVCSHSEADIIGNHYRKKGNGFFPELIFGWNDDASKMKPEIYPVQKTMEKFNLQKSEILVVDDLKPGYIMAKRAEIDFAAAGWAHYIIPIEKFMRNHADFYLSEIEELSRLLF